MKNKNENISNTPDAAPSELTPEQRAEILARAAKADEHWDRLLRVTRRPRTDGSHSVCQRLPVSKTAAHSG
jgi:hypothetical protein